MGGQPIPARVFLGGHPVLFILKLYDIVGNINYDIISWSSDGKSFTIKDRERLVEEVLPMYFRHNKFTSFQRQLHHYRFQSGEWGTNSWSFSHPNFIRGNIEALLLIERRDYTQKNGGGKNKRRCASSDETSRVAGQARNSNDDDLTHHAPGKTKSDAVEDSDPKRTRTEVVLLPKCNSCPGVSMSVGQSEQGNKKIQPTAPPPPNTIMLPAMPYFPPATAAAVAPPAFRRQILPLLHHKKCQPPGAAVDVNDADTASDTNASKTTDTTTNSFATTTTTTGTTFVPPHLGCSSSSNLIRAAVIKKHPALLKNIQAAAAVAAAASVVDFEFG